MKYRLFAIILSLMIFHTAVGLCIDGNEILQNVKKKYDSIKYFSADFTQQFQWKLTGQVQDQNGRILLSGTDKFRIETKDQTIVSNGKTLWTYSALYHQVIIDDIEKAEEVVLPRELFLNFSNKYTPKLMGEESFEEQQCYLVQLDAKSDDIFIRQMTVWVKKDDWTTVKIEHKDLNENTTTYIIRNIAFNNTLKDDTFRFATPQDAEVIDMR